MTGPNEQFLERGGRVVSRSGRANIAAPHLELFPRDSDLLIDVLQLVRAA